MAEKKIQKTPVSKKNSKQKKESAFRYDILLLAVLGISTLVVYSSCFKFEFTNWDENRLILETQMVHKLNWTNIREIFSSKVLMSYNPLVELSFAVDYALVKTSAGWYHGINVMLHLINSLLVFVCIRKLTKSILISGIVAFLFALHPMHVESVAWVASRKDVLYATFFFLSWICYITFTETKKRKLYVYSIILFLLSLLAKPQAMILPVVLLLTDVYLFKKWDWKSFTDKIPFFILAVVFGYIALFGSNATADLFAKPFSFPEKLFYSVIAFGFYLVKFIAPVNQSAIYAFPGSDSTEYVVEIIFFIVVIAALMYFGKKYLKKYPLFAFGLAFFAVAIAPTLHLVAVNSSLIYERFSYISYIGLSLAAASLLLKENGEFKKNMLWIFILVMVGFSVLANARTGVWKNSETLWLDVIEKNPTSNEANNNLGNYYRERGEGEKAFPYYTAAIEVNPNHPDAYNNRSIIYFNRGDIENALKDNANSLRINPKSAEANNNRGIYYMEKFPDSTLFYCSKAIQYSPKFSLAWHNRAIAYYKKEQFENAVSDYQQSIVIDPNFERSYQYMGLAYLKMNKLDDAENCSRMALKINPRSDGINNMSYEMVQKGNQYLKTDSFDLALNCYEHAADAVPGNSDAWYNIGLCYFKKRDIVKARQYWEKTLQLNPNNKDAAGWLQQTAGLK